MASDLTLIEGRYEQHELLASGGLANVYLGWDREACSAVAIKRLRDDWSQEIQDDGLNDLEAQCLQVLKHENVMGLYAFGEDGDGFYQVMELITGPNLQQIIDAVVPAMPDFVEIARQSLLGLAAMHQQSVIHCDIKPDNIMLTLLGNGKQRVKIIDFGLARFEGRVAELGRMAKQEIMGTPEFVSPELLLGDDPTKRSDLYALGHVFYYALAGRPAFDKATVEATLEAHLNERPVDLCQIRTDISLELGNWVHQFIERYPEARHASAESALTELLTLQVWADADL
jgi:serine/threonine protein kinase